VTVKLEESALKAIAEASKGADENGNPAENAKVKFKLYNYAEYYPISSGETDKDGNASLTTGLGDLLIWANKDGKYDYAKIDVRENDAITLKLNHTSGKEYEEDFDIVPPAGRPVTTSVTPDEADKNNKRLSYEDSLRNAYLKTFPTDEEIAKIENKNLTPEQIHEIVKKSEGNYKEITAFLNAHKEKNENLFLYSFLSSLSYKDLRDCEAETLNQHLVEYDGKYPVSVFQKGILPARIEVEMIRPWRQFLKENLSKIFGAAPSYSAILDWTKANIQTDTEGNYFNCPISPRGVFELRHADSRSRDIFFVAACRSMNIPAYLDNATRQIFVYDNDKWQIVAMEDAKPVAKTGKLILKYNGTDELKPQYWTHYTIAKFEDGYFTTFDYEDDPRVAKFPVELELEEGYYMLSTGNRYSDGEVLSHLEFFNIKQGETMEREVKIRPLVQREKEFYGFISSDSQIEVDGKTINLNDLTKEKPLVLCFIDPIREPTKHNLKEFGAMRETYEKWGGNILMAVPAEKLTEPFSAEKWNLPKQTIVTTDTNGLMEKILTDTKQQFNDNLPLIFIVETNGKITFRSDGYRIGTAELIYKSITD
ncbi:MAG: hypothetical protein IKJ56_03600, partial [Bacteroidales bacterium]|nr:hypothetical protein [Bacteroidales bacterium]